MKVKAVKVVFSGDGKLDKDELAKAIAEALPDDLEAEKGSDAEPESESDAEPEGKDDCEKCPSKDECSDEKKSKHKATVNVLAKGHAFMKALHVVMDGIEAGKADRNEFADNLDKLAEASKAFGDAIRSK